MRARQHEGALDVPEGLLAGMLMSGASTAVPEVSSIDTTAIRVLISSWAGTGGSADHSAAMMLPGTGGFLSPSRRERRIPVAVLDDTADKIALIRSTLSLNVRELATALRVGRPTIYAWIAGTAEPQTLNRRRIDAVVALAREWAELHSRPLGALRREGGTDGRSIMDLLESDEIDVESVRSLLGAAARKLKSQAGAAKGIGLAERARARGFELAEPPDAQRQLDRLTGKRIAPE